MLEIKFLLILRSLCSYNHLGYWKYEPKYTLATLFKNIDRLKAFEMPDMAPALKMMHDIIHWKYPVLSFFVWVGVVGGVYTFEPWMITAALPPVLIMGRIAPGLFIKHKGKTFW